MHISFKCMLFGLMRAALAMTGSSVSASVTSLPFLQTLCQGPCLDGPSFFLPVFGECKIRVRFQQAVVITVWGWSSGSFRGAGFKYVSRKSTLTAKCLGPFPRQRLVGDKATGLFFCQWSEVFKMLICV